MKIPDTILAMVRDIYWILLLVIYWIGGSFLHNTKVWYRWWKVHLPEEKTYLRVNRIIWKKPAWFTYTERITIQRYPIGKYVNVSTKKAWCLILKLTLITLRFFKNVVLMTPFYCDARRYLDFLKYTMGITTKGWLPQKDETILVFDEIKARQYFIKSLHTQNNVTLVSERYSVRIIWPCECKPSWLG